MFALKCSVAPLKVINLIIIWSMFSSVLFSNDNLRVKSKNLLNSIDFTHDNGWIIWSESIIKKSGGKAKISNGSINIKTPAKSIAGGTIQLLKNIEINDKTTFLLKFKAKTDKRQKIDVSLSLFASPYTAFSKETVILDVDKSEYSIVLNCSDIASANKKRKKCLRISMKQFTGAKVKLSNITLEAYNSLKINDEWDAFLLCKPPVDYSYIPDELFRSDGKGKAQLQKVKLNNNAVDLSKIVKPAGSYKEADGSVSILFNKFTSKYSCNMLMGVAADYWLEVYINNKMIFSTIPAGNGTTKYSVNNHLVVLPVKKGENLLAVKVISGSKGWRFFCGAPYYQGQLPTIKYIANNEWKPIVKLGEVKGGTALDLSKISSLPLQSDRTNILSINKQGRFSIGNNNTTNIRLMGMHFPGEWLFKKLPEKHVIDECITQAKRRGYNLFRFYSIDMLSAKSGKISPERLDRFCYLLAKMKQSNMYMHLTIFTYMLNQKWVPGFMKDRNNYKALMYLGDKVIRKEWKSFAHALLNHTNPYNGIKLKDDPTIGIIEFYNEQDVIFRNKWKKKLKKNTILTFNQQFRGWLKRKYGTIEKLSLAWQNNTLKRFEEISVPDKLYRKISSEVIDTNLQDDFVLFLNELSLNNINWYEKVIKEIGYQGLTGQFDCPDWLGDNAVRYAKSPVALCHKYFAHPTGASFRKDREGINYNPWGSIINPKSSVEEEGSYFRSTNTTKFCDRPFYVSELDHGFWNKNKYELGVLFGAYASFQDFSAITFLASDILPECAKIYFPENQLNSFSGTNNPIFRANEFLTACLFLRKDVSKHLNNINLQIPSSDLNKYGVVSTEQSKIALMTGLFVSFNGISPVNSLQKNIAINDTITLSSSSSTKGSFWASEAIDEDDKTFSIKNYCKLLKQKGLLSNNNISNPSQGIFQSDTQEITMHSKKKLLKVITPFTEALTIDKNSSEELKFLKVIRSSTNAAVSVSTMDEKIIPKSKRMVLIYSTEVVNSGLELSEDMRELIDLGNRPILMKTGTLEITIKHASAESLKLYALNFDGTRSEVIPIKVEPGSVKIKIDTSKLKNGPTNFFEISN